MRAREFLLEYRDITDPAFQRWFKGSEVVDENGKPEIVYHGTINNGQIDVFYDESHFGTSKAASDRINDILKLPTGARPFNMPGEGDEAPHVYPVYLSIKNPIQLEDMGDWTGAEMWHSLFDSGYMEDIAADLGFSPEEPLDPFEVMEAAFKSGIDPIDWIKRNGFDGIKYYNEFEDKGSVSWIPFSGKQVVSAIDGKQLHEKLIIERRFS